MDPISWTTYLVTTSLNFGIQFMFYLSLVGTLMIPMVIYLAAKGRSIGVRRGYVKILLAVFDYGRQKIEENDSKYDASEETAPQQIDVEDDSDDPGHVIEREVLMSTRGMKIVSQRSVQEMDSDFALSDIMYFTKSGLEAIIEDEVTQRFSAEELSSWNLLTRTNTKPQFISIKLTILWAVGFILRYIILLPFRLTLAITGILLLIFGTAVIGLMSEGEKKRKYYDILSMTSFRIMARGLSAVINFHNKENRAKGGGICVANHTSPIDVVILGCDNTYAMVGQQQGGFFGVMEQAMSRATAHVWFNRSESSDRLAVARRLKEHVSDKKNLPILIFPEGTCVNNTSIMMFKKGSFEIGTTVYPVAIKYDPRFADAFWNSSKENFVTHILLMLTSWALVCDVWYLPPETQREGENAIQFANRIKSKIAEQGGLVDLEWDGALKRNRPKDSFKEKHQEDFSKRLKGE